MTDITINLTWRWITINLTLLMKLLEAVFAILHRLLPGSSRNHKSNNNKRSSDGKRSNINNGGKKDVERDPFEILGLEGGKANTTIEMAEKARRKLAMKWHPDRNIGNEEEATKKMQEINDAFTQVEKILGKRRRKGEAKASKHKNSNHTSSSDGNRSNSYGSSSNEANEDGDRGSDGETNNGTEKEERDPFDILGLKGGKDNTTMEEAKKAWRKLAMKWHPDRNIGNEEEATKKMQEINDAFTQVEKILEGGVDGEDDVAESDDESVESEGAKRRAREKWRKQKYDEARDFVRKFREEIATFERAQMDAERGNFASPSYATASASKPKYFGERGRRRAARKRAKDNNRPNESRNAADESNIPFHRWPPEKRCEVKFRSKNLLKMPTFTATRIRAYNVLQMLLEDPPAPLSIPPDEGGASVFVTPLMVASYLGDYTAVDIIIRNSREKWRETVLAKSLPGREDSLALAKEALEIAQLLYNESKAHQAEAKTQGERDAHEEIVAEYATGLEAAEKLVERLAGMKQLALEKKKKDDIRYLLKIFVGLVVGLVACIVSLLIYHCLESSWTYLAYLQGLLVTYYIDTFGRNEAFEPSHPSKAGINEPPSSKPNDPPDFFCLGGALCDKGDKCTDKILKLDCECGDDLKYICTKHVSADWTRKTSFDHINSESTATESIAVGVCLALICGGLLFTFRGSLQRGGKKKKTKKRGKKKK